MNEFFPPLAPVSSLFSLQELAPSRGVEGRASPQGYQFYLPVGSPPRAYFPSSPFVGQNREKPVSPESSLFCRWMKVKLRSPHLISHKPSHLSYIIYLISPLQCHQLFNSLQDLVDHINDFHVKPEKDSGYCCQWEGCARNGRGFNAR